MNFNFYLIHIVLRSSKLKFNLSTYIKFGWEYGTHSLDKLIKNYNFGGFAQCTVLLLEQWVQIKKRLE